MLHYFFRARNDQGAVVLDSIHATSELEAKKLISSMGLIPIEVQTKPHTSTVTNFNLSENIKSIFSKLKNLMGPQISMDEFLSFNRQFQIIYKVGMPIVKGLDLIAKQATNPKLKSTLLAIREDVSNGRALHEAFAAHPDVFDEAYVSLIRVGETSGKLDNILEKIGQFTAEKVENRERIKTAMLYPKIVLLVFLITVLIVVYFVIPKIKVFFDQFKAKLPLPTEILIGISTFCVDYWYLLISFSMLGVWGFRKFYKTLQGRAMIDRMYLKIPILGSLVQALETRTFCATMELLIVGGVPILDSLKLVKASLSNVQFRNEVDRCIASVDNGGTMSTELEKGNVFPALVPGLLSVGEDTGEMEKVLGQIGSYYQAQIKNRLENLTKLIEPLLMIVVFAGVMLLALAIYLPIWRMNTLVKNAN